MNEIVFELKNFYFKLSGRIDNLSMRERVLIFITSLMILYFVWYSLLYGYFLSSEQQISENTKIVKGQVSALQEKIDALSELIGQDTTESLYKRAKQLRIENEALKKTITEQTIQMVAPKEMAEIVKSIIQETAGLQLISLESTGAVPLFPAEKAKQTFQIYNHGLDVEMVGHYKDILRFLEGIEKHKHKLLWDSLRYEVQEYPEAKIKISIHTLGLEEAWIGV